MTTLEELQRLSDEQLIEKVAVEVMGFQKVIQKKQGPRFLTTWLRDPNRRLNAAKKWLPLEDWNHTMEVVVEVRNCRINQFASYFPGSFIDCAQRAICRAPLLAFSQS